MPGSPADDAGRLARSIGPPEARTFPGSGRLVTLDGVLYAAAVISLWSPA